MAIAAEEVLGLESASSPNAIAPLGVVALTPGELTDIVREFAASDRWMERVRLRAGERWYERLHAGADHDIWAISWMPGQGTGFHDHGESAGAFVVVTGALEEHRPGEQPAAILPRHTRAFGPGYAHDVRNVSVGPAVSIHAYSPPLNEMNEFELIGERLVPRQEATERAEGLRHDTRVRVAKQAEGWDAASSIEQVLQRARERLRRLSANEAAAAVGAGAVLVDIRPERQRAAEGSVSGAIVVERNVLEWRFDPESSARLPIATGRDLQVVVICSEGYTSSLAAAALQELGLWRATDVVGGFRAWHAAGLPVDLRGRTA